MVARANNLTINQFGCLNFLCQKHRAAENKFQIKFERLNRETVSSSDRIVTSNSKFGMT